MDKDLQDYYFRKMGMYVDNAKSYIQIAVGSLVLPITFLRQLAGSEAGQVRVDGYLMLAWVAFLLSIGSGLLYQYLAVKVIERIFEKKDENWFINHPRYVYATMQLSFYLGAIAFVAFAINRI